MQDDKMPRHSKRGTQAGMISAKDAAKLLGVSDRRIRVLCEQGRIKGAQKIANGWILPDNPKVDAADRIRPGVIEVTLNQRRKRKA
jgi:hypothetical protein